MAWPAFELYWNFQYFNASEKHCSRIRSDTTCYTWFLDRTPSAPQKWGALSVACHQGGGWCLSLCLNLDMHNWQQCIIFLTFSSFITIFFFPNLSFPNLSPHPSRCTNQCPIALRAPSSPLKYFVAKRACIAIGRWLVQPLSEGLH
jgi:hypothetical protein